MASLPADLYCRLGLVSFLGAACFGDQLDANDLSRRGRVDQGYTHYGFCNRKSVNCSSDVGGKE